MSKKINGIYAITNKINGKKYIGSSKSVHYRWRQNHVPALKRKAHPNRHLQSAWNKYGEENFVFEVIEECEKERSLEREGHWIEHYRSWEREFGYNLTRVVDEKQVLSNESKLLISEKAKTSRCQDYWITGTNAEIINLFNQKISKSAIAKQLGITRSEVYSCLEHNSLYVKTGRGSEIKLTPEVELKIEALRAQKTSWEEIFRITGISKTQIYRTENANDGKYGGSRNRATYETMTPVIKRRAIKMRKAGHSWKDIASKLGVDRTLFYRHGLTSNRKDMVRKTMTEEAKKEILQLRGEGKTWVEIARLTGFNEETFRRHKLHKVVL